MTSAQEQTVARYHEWMQVNATAQFLRTAREIGLLDQLRGRQHTVEDLCAALGLETEPTRMFIDALIAIGVVEQFGDDIALSRAAQLLCQYDEDLGDATWNRLNKTLKATTAGMSAENAETSAKNTEEYFHYQAATQWVHTPAAMQAAEVLDIGGEGESGIKIIDLGCGSAVWGCAMAHRDPASTLTVVDHIGAIEAARNMASSIDLLNRFETITGDPMSVETPKGVFDLALLAQQISAVDDTAARQLVDRAVSAIKPGGRVVVIDLFRVPAKADENADEPSSELSYAKPSVAESMEALRLCVSTDHGRLRTLPQAKALLVRAGLQHVQFAYLSASRLNLGIAVGVKPNTAQ